MEKKFKNQILSVLSVVVVAVLGSVFVGLGMGWFNGLLKPDQWIPNFVIPIVWTLIYLIVSIYIAILSKSDRFDKNNIILFVVNGVLNVLWCLVFFTLHQTFLGLIVIVLNLVAGYVLYLRQDRKVVLARVLVIYPLWLSIATLLNTAIWILN